MDRSLPGVAKISKRIDYEQLYDDLNKNALLSNRQSGFRSLERTLTALFDTSDKRCVNIDKGYLNGVICVDPKKAFFLKKLAKYGIDGNASGMVWVLLNQSQAKM